MAFLDLIEGFEDLDRWSRSLEGVQNPFQADLLDVVGERLLSNVQRRFEYTKEDPDGSAWDPVKRDPGFGSILYRTHELYDSLTMLNDHRSIAVGSDDVRAAALNFGRPEINLPARGFIGYAKQDADDVAEVTAEWLEEALQP